MLNITRDTENFNKIPKDKICELSKHQFYKISNVKTRKDIGIKYYTNVSIDKLKSRSKYLCCMHKPKIAVISVNGKFTSIGINILNDSKNIIGSLTTVRLGVKKYINYHKSADIGIIMLGKDEVYTKRIFNFVKHCCKNIAKNLIFVVLSTGKTKNLVSDPNISNYIMGCINEKYQNRVLVFSFSKKPSSIQQMVMKNIIIQYNRAFCLTSDELEKYTKEIFKLYNLSFKN